MPHSSGGGSHGGGSHGGSHGGHGGGSSVRTSKTYFAGAHKYVYYKNNHPVYYYRSKPIDRSAGQLSAKSGLFMAIFVMAIYVFVLFGMVKAVVNVPKKLSTDYDTTVLVYDTADIVSDKEEEKLIKTFTEFRDKTGITPAFMTVRNNVWKGHYSDLENFAYDVYVNTYSDEKHWLIVYSQDYTEDDWNDWYWEGMQGDDTDNIITTDVGKRFTKNVQKYMTDERISPADAVNKGFKDLMPGIMKVSFDKMAFFAFPFIIFHAFFMITGLFVTPAKNRKLAEKSIEIADAAGPTREDVCAYCQGVYVHGLHFSCPHCGAPIQASGAPVYVPGGQMQGGGAAMNTYAGQTAYADPFAADDPFAQYDKNDPFADVHNGGGFG